MSLDPLSLKPMGSKLIVKRDPPPKQIGGIALPEQAHGKKVCNECRGLGCFPVPIYEEDGIKISRHEELPCRKCGGRGYKSKRYDPRNRLRNFMATVVAVGPGRTCRKIRKADYKTIHYYDAREPMELKPGDRVMLARWAGWSGESFFLDEEEDGYMIVNQWEVLAVGERPTVPDSGTPSPQSLSTPQAQNLLPGSTEPPETGSHSR